MSRRWVWIGVAGALGLLVLVGLTQLARRPETDASVVTARLPREGDRGGQARAGQAPAGQAGQEADNARVLLAKADNARIHGSYDEAKRLYEELLQRSPDPQTAAAAQEKLGEVNVKRLLSPARPFLQQQAGGPARSSEDDVYAVKPGDTLSRIGKAHHVTVALLKAANGLKEDLIRVDQRLRIPKASFSVIVDKSQNRLTLKNGEEVFKVYRCSTGMGGITPTGEYRIVSRLVDPVWKGIVPPGDPENPLGSRWMGFDLPEYGIHGTSQPETIGQAVTKGCIRLTNPDVEELYVLLPEGTPVKVVE